MTASDRAAWRRRRVPSSACRLVELHQRYFAAEHIAEPARDRQYDAVGPSVSLPIFSGGRLRSTLELREAQQQEAATTYRKTVLQAWHDVVNALVAHRLEQNRRARLRSQADHSRAALELARARYNDGVTEFLNVLDAERSLLDADQQYAASTTNVSLDLVQLFKALGGGWETTFPDVPSETAAVPVPGIAVDAAIDTHYHAEPAGIPPGPVQGSGSPGL
jgi:hypothetical protein